jgi:hypothetical protein
MEDKKTSDLRSPNRNSTKNSKVTVRLIRDIDMDINGQYPIQ